MSEIHIDDTIAAISTPPGEGGIGIVRISGPASIAIAMRLFHSSNGTRLNQVDSHTVHFGYVRGEDGQAVDQVLVSVFHAPKSYTAEDVVEISAHGGSCILKKILELALSSGARHAEPGEFTRRAFLNGRMDLAQAEAVSDLIRAKTDRSLEVALRQLSGKLSGEVQSIKEQLMKLYAHMEACLDFPDEHLEVYSNAQLRSQFETVRQRLLVLVQSFSKGQILREGAQVALVGRPNVGKSSLLNVLLARDRALVSEVPGTTRDVLEESIDLDGLWVRLADTAGLWASRNSLDQAAMERTRQCIQESDLCLWILDAGDGYLEEDELIFDQIRNKKTIAAVNKMDLPDPKDFRELRRRVDDISICFISAKTGQGIESLEKKIGDFILEHEVGSESVVITRMRHKKALEASLQALEKSFHAFIEKESLEFVILDLKQSLDALKELIGEIYSEDLLDVIFGEFCIGK